MATQNLKHCATGMINRIFRPVLMTIALTFGLVCFEPCPGLYLLQSFAKEEQLLVELTRLKDTLSNLEKESKTLNEKAKNLKRSAIPNTESRSDEDRKRDLERYNQDANKLMREIDRYGDSLQRILEKLRNQQLKLGNFNNAKLNEAQNQDGNDRARAIENMIHALKERTNALERLLTETKGNSTNKKGGSPIIGSTMK